MQPEQVAPDDRKTVYKQLVQRQLKGRVCFFFAGLAVAGGIYVFLTALFSGGAARTVLMALAVIVAGGLCMVVQRISDRARRKSIARLKMELGGRES